VKYFGKLATRSPIRFDISVLETSHPELAKRLQNLQFKLDSRHETIVTTRTTDTPISATERRIIQSKEFTELLTTIRKLPGFELFLLCPSESEMKSRAKDGPIVVFNVSKIRSDDFLIDTKNIRCFPLLLLTSSDFVADCQPPLKRPEVFVFVPTVRRS